MAGDTTPEPVRKKKKSSKDKPRREKRTESPVVMVEAVPVVVDRPPNVVQRNIVIGGGPQYPPLDSRSHMPPVAAPSAPPPASAVSRPSSPEYSEGAAERGEARPKERKKKSSNPASPSKDSKDPKKKKKVSKEVIAEKEREDVRKIREAEARGSYKPSSSRDKDSKQRRELDARRRNLQMTEKERSYPVRVDWSNPGETSSYISLLIIAGLLALVGVTTYALLGVDVKLPEGSPSTNTSFTYNNITYDSTSTTGQLNNLTITTLPTLVSELLSLDNAPSFACSNVYGAEDVFAAIKANPTSKVTYANTLRVTGTECANSTFRVGYCVRDPTCRAINDRVANQSSDTYGACATSVGPRRYGSIFISDTFVENFTQFWYLPIVPVAVALLMGLIWLMLSLKSPVNAPQILAFLALATGICLYLAWLFALPETVNNFYVLIYYFCVALFLVFTGGYQKRVGKIFAIGQRVMSGEALDTSLRGMAEKTQMAIVGPAIVVAVVQAAVSILFLFLVAACPYVVEFFSEINLNPAFIQAIWWKQFFLGLVPYLDMGTYNPPIPSQGSTMEYAFIRSLTCSMNPLTKLNAAVIVYCVFYFFVAIYTQFATRFLVNASVADWYFFGTKRYKSIPSGPASVGTLALTRAMLVCGHKILPHGLWSTLATSSMSVMAGAKSFIIHTLISPVDCLVYSTIGFLFTGLSQHKNRFALVHASMCGGRFPTMEACNKASTALIRKHYGRRYAAVGDSPEVRLLSICANALAVGCGLIVWVWLDTLQQFDTVTYMGGWVLLVLWLTGSFIQKPAVAVLVAVLIDSQAAWRLSLQGQMCKNSVMGFIIMSAVCNSVLKILLEIPASATDAVVYCYALELSRRRRIRSLELDEMIHRDYLGDIGMVPKGTRLEKIVIQCPANARPGHSLTIDVEGHVHEVKIPLGARPGRDFEVAIPVPINNLDLDDIQEESEQDYDESNESEEYIGGRPGGADKAVVEYTNQPIGDVTSGGYMSSSIGGEATARTHVMASDRGYNPTIVQQSRW